MRRQPNVCLCFTGDGATSPGDFYEGVNFAAIHKLPLVIICEVNQFAYSTPPQLQMPVENVADRAAGFGIYTETAFGNDLFTVIAAAKRGIEHARNGNGPALIEFKTFRRRGHGEHDDMAYVSKELRAFWEERDPLVMYRSWLTLRAGVDETAITQIEADCTGQVEAAVEYADALSFPNGDTVSQRLFAPSPHDPRPEDRQNIYQSIENPAIPSLTAARDKSSDGHF